MPKAVGEERYFDSEKAEAVLQAMREGMTLKAISRMDGMPTYDTVWNWKNGHLRAPSTWADDYARARQDQADGFVADILEIADGLSDEAQERAANELAELPDNASPLKRARVIQLAKRNTVDEARVRIDVRKWAAGRMAPGRWGDRVTLQHTTLDDKPLRVDFSGLSTEQLEAIANLEQTIATDQEDSKS